MNLANMAIGQAKQEPKLPRSASNVMGRVLELLLFNRVAGQVEVPARQVNFRVSLPRSASNVLEPMFHPATGNFLTCLKQRAF